MPQERRPILFRRQLRLPAAGVIGDGDAPLLAQLLYPGQRPFEGAPPPPAQDIECPLRGYDAAAEGLESLGEVPHSA